MYISDDEQGGTKIVIFILTPGVGVPVLGLQLLAI